MAFPGETSVSHELIKLEQLAPRCRRYRKLCHRLAVTLLQIDCTPCIARLMPLILRKAEWKHIHAYAPCRIRHNPKHN